MLERAKARREKLDEQLSNAGHDVKRRRSPLKNANALLEQATGNFPMSIYFVNCYEILMVRLKVDLSQNKLQGKISLASCLFKEIATTSENSVKSPVKATATSAVPVKSPRKSPVSKNVASENNKQDNKENGEFETYKARSKLHRLGKLYSGK